MIVKKNESFTIPSNYKFGKLSKRKLPHRTSSPCYWFTLHEIKGSVDRIVEQKQTDKSNCYTIMYKAATPAITLNQDGFKFNASAYYCGVEVINSAICGLGSCILSHTTYHVYCKFSSVLTSYYHCCRCTRGCH